MNPNDISEKEHLTELNLKDSGVYIYILEKTLLSSYLLHNYNL